MADNVAITAGSGTTIATDDCGAGGHAQVMKLAISADGSVTFIPADAANGLDVDVTRLPALVAGAAEIGGVNQTKVSGTAVSVNSGTKDAGTQRVILASDQTLVPTDDVVASTATLSSVASSLTSVAIRSSNSARRGLLIYNDSTSIAYVKYGTAASTISFTLIMQPGDLFEMPKPIYTGALEAIWLSTGGTMRMTELTA